MRTDRTVANNKPDIVLCDDKQGTCMLMDVTIPADRNVIKKGAGKILKYKDIIMEIQRMWNVEANVIPVIMGGRLGPFQDHSVRDCKKQPYCALHTNCGKC